LGLTAAAGRLYSKEDASHAVIGSHLWKQRYGGLSSAIGSNLKIAGREYRIAGIVDDKAGPFDADVWLPPPTPVTYGGLIARLKRGAALRDAAPRVAGRPPGSPGCGAPTAIRRSISLSGYARQRSWPR
jgi:MacB-like periplasmic core domain